jgi:uncharacterized coiled-coil protein SlyX
LSRRPARLHSEGVSDSRLDAQAKSYQNASPVVLRDQLNECWTKLRAFERAVASRDRQIDELTKSLAARDLIVSRLQKRLTFARAKVAALYAIIGAAVAKTLELVVLHWLMK